MKDVVSRGGTSSGLVSVYAQGATVAIMIQENWVESVADRRGAFTAAADTQMLGLHDQQDGNGDSHLKSGLVGLSETIPVINGTSRYIRVSILLLNTGGL